MPDSDVALLEKAGRNGHSDSIEKALITGDLAKLSPDERLSYYRQVCESVGLNPLTQPFDYIVLNNRLTLYAKKNCTEQLRQIHRVSIKIVAREVMEDCYVVTAQARTPDGRDDESIGVVNIDKLKGEMRANAMMKAETKAKRRVTLSICGLGMLDETEVDSIPNAYRDPLMSAEANGGSDADKAAADAVRAANPPAPPKPNATQQQYDAFTDIVADLEIPSPEVVEMFKAAKVKRFSHLTEENAAAMVLELCKKQVKKLLTELQFNLDDVRAEAPSVTADTADELDQDQANAVLAVLRAVKRRQEG